MLLVKQEKIVSTLTIVIFLLVFIIPAGSAYAIKQPGIIIGVQDPFAENLDLNDIAVKVAIVNDNTVHLEWVPTEISQDALVKYAIKQNGKYIINDLLADARSYDIVNLRPGIDYCFVVTQTSTNENSSRYLASLAVCGKTNIGFETEQIPKPQPIEYSDTIMCSLIDQKPFYDCSEMWTIRILKHKEFLGLSGLCGQTQLETGEIIPISGCAWHSRNTIYLAEETLNMVDACGHDILWHELNHLKEGPDQNFHEVEGFENYCW